MGLDEQVGAVLGRCGLAFVPTNELEGRSAIALVELLKLPDEFFAEDMAKVNVFDK